MATARNRSLRPTTPSRVAVAAPPQTRRADVDPVPTPNGRRNLGRTAPGMRVCTNSERNRVDCHLPNFAFHQRKICHKCQQYIRRGHRPSRSPVARSRLETGVLAVVASREQDVSSSHGVKQHRLHGRRRGNPPAFAKHPRDELGQPPGSRTRRATSFRREAMISQLFILSPRGDGAFGTRSAA